MCDKSGWNRPMKNLTKSQPGITTKGWGHERIIHSTEQYCGKELVFAKKGNKMSFHYHKHKYEEWTVTGGSFMLITATADRNSTHDYIVNGGHSSVERRAIYINEMVFIKPFVIHQLVALEDNSVIFEVSSVDYLEDSYRVQPGDSQTKGV